MSKQAKEHIERIRRDRYYIGREEKNPLAEDLQQAVNYLSNELYSKDVHFLMELIQNAEDNEYPSGVAPSLEFVITSKDITGTGANSTLLVFNNEKGFSEANIESIIRVGKSTKKGQRHRGYIGEKGIGFKSVFLISNQPHIFSNGYQIKFDEEPSSDCDLGYIVPQWVDQNPTRSDLMNIYGASKTLPTTTIILPLKPDKVDPVKRQLSSIHPEILLFLSKIRNLSVREDNPSNPSITQISISSEKDHQMRKNVDAESFKLHLAAQESSQRGEDQCIYYMWKQKFAVKRECRVKKREEVDEWVITLAFPHGERLSRGLSSSSVYAFLPTEMVTNFPFIIQADFLLSSSRETILMDNQWNKGILDCVPTAFVNAFVSMVKSTTFVNAPASSLASKFWFLPVKECSIPLLESVRKSIKDKLVGEVIIPCESYTPQSIFCKPNEAGRLIPTFWDVLINARKCGVDLRNISSHGTCVISSSFDTREYTDVLEFLGIGYVDSSWYPKCIEGSNLVKEASDEVYLELLCFIANNWQAHFANNGKIMHVPLLKYENSNGALSFSSIASATQGYLSLCMASEKCHMSWLMSSNRELALSSRRFFLSSGAQEKLHGYSNKSVVMDWLQSKAKLEVLGIYGYAAIVSEGTNVKQQAILFAHFMYHSYAKDYMQDWNIKNLCANMPVVDNYGVVVAQSQRNQLLVPAKGSKWVELMGSNPWRGEKYIELSAEYENAGYFAGNYASESTVLDFVKTYLGASDVPHINPPNASFPTVSSSLTKKNAILILQWIKNLRGKGVRLPDRFLQCIKNGSWIKTSIGYKPPNESFLSSQEWGTLLQIGSDMVDIPMIDQEFYDGKMSDFKEELKIIGVKFEFGEASEFIGQHLMKIAAERSLTRSNVLSLLKLIRFLREKHLSPSHLVGSINKDQWLKTTKGYKTPKDAIFFDSEWKAASLVSSLPFIDTDFYGGFICDYKTELELLGVVTGFKNNHKLVVDNFAFRASVVTAQEVMLLLECIRYVIGAESLINKLKQEKWVKTNVGVKAPSETFLPDSEWLCVLKAIEGLPIIDLNYYETRILSWKEELRRIGVVVRFDDASKAIAEKFKQMIPYSLSEKNRTLILDSYRQLKSKVDFLPVVTCLRKENWLSTDLGFKAPKDSVLFDLAWEPLCSIATLPFIDRASKICEYKDELKDLGVAIGIEQGSKFVISGLNIPSDPKVLTASTVLSLLKCIKCFKKGSAIPKAFMSGIKKKWVKTVMGYKCPDESILFNLKVEHFSVVQRTDGPFIDEEFYGSEILNYGHEFAEIGVKVDASSASSLMAEHLKLHSDTNTISRIYAFLQKTEWKSDDKNSDWIWIPSSDNNGQWVSPKNSVVHDKDRLFGSQLHVLEKYYGSSLLNFFSAAFDVKYRPDIEDYCELWKHWEGQGSDCHVSVSDCTAFWEFVQAHWSQKSGKMVSESVTKLPVLTQNGISLASKDDVFIPDDLLLKDLFEESKFVWYPPKTTHRAKFTSIYTQIGARKISECVEKCEASDLENSASFTTIGEKSNVIQLGLLKISLAFLADPCLDICVKDRHETVKPLLNLTIFETKEQLTINYSLAQNSVRVTQMGRWEREKETLYIQRVDGSEGMECKIKFATYFANEMVNGLLYERPDLIGSLVEIIKLACLLDFEEGAIRFVLKTRNLQLFLEDEEFLASHL